MLTGKDGRFVDFAPFDPNIDAALFPLLFPYGQRTYESSIPLNKTETHNKNKQIDNINQSIVHEQFSDDEENEEDECHRAEDDESNADNNPDHSDNDDGVDGETIECSAGGPKWKVCNKKYSDFCIPILRK